MLAPSRTAGARPDPRYGDAPMQLATDLTFRCPALTLAVARARQGLPVWHYEFDLPASGGCVTHSAELPFVFKGLPIGQPPLNLQRYWAAFARSRDPNGAGMPDWRAFAPTQASLRFAQDGAHVVTGLRRDTCALLDLP